MIMTVEEQVTNEAMAGFSFADPDASNQLRQLLIARLGVGPDGLPIDKKTNLPAVASFQTALASPEFNRFRSGPPIDPAAAARAAREEQITQARRASMVSKLTQVGGLPARTDNRTMAYPLGRKPA
jgi:hypothetical protein